MYGTSTIHKVNTPLRTIVSSCGSISYDAARHIASVLSPLVGNTGHSVKNNGDLVKQLSGPGQKLCLL